MRHQKSGRKLNRTASHRKAMLGNLAAALVFNKRIITTQPKAKELSSFIERLVTYAKKEDSVHARRLIQRKVPLRLHKKISNILMHDIVPNYSNRNGGYTRIIKLANRKNDNAKQALIEFVDLPIDSEIEKTDNLEKTE